MILVSAGRLWSLVIYRERNNMSVDRSRSLENI